jgi:hypothetical protein
MRLTIFAAAIVLLPSITLSNEQQRSEASPARPNILFIVSDDHGWGDLPSNWDDTEVQLPTL